MASLASLFGEFVEKTGKEAAEKLDDAARIAAAKASNEALKGMDMGAMVESIQKGTATKQQLIAFANASEIDLKGAKKRDDILVRINESLEGLEAYEDKLRNSPIVKKRLNPDSMPELEEYGKRKITWNKSATDAVTEQIGDNRNITKEEYKRMRQEAKSQSGTIQEQNARIEAQRQGVEKTKSKRLSKIHEEALVINERIDNPASIAKLNPTERRAALNEAFVSGGDGFVKNVADQAMLDADLLYKIDADDDFIKNVHGKINSDEFISNSAKTKWESGKFKKEYSSFGKDTAWDDLTDAQRNALIDDIKNNEVKAFNDALSGEKTTGWGFKKKTELTGEMDLQAGRQRYMREKLGFDPSGKAYKKITKKLGKLDDDKALNAYKAYHSQAMDIYNAGTSTALPGAKDFYSKELGLSDTTIETVMSGMGKGGIDSKSKHTGLKVAAGIAGGTIALWGLSEVYDE